MCFEWTKVYENEAGQSTRDCHYYWYEDEKCHLDKEDMSQCVIKLGLNCDNYTLTAML